MLATPGALPKGEGWVFEQKWDGMRATTRVHLGAELYSRNGNRLTSFPELCEALATALNGRSAILDGEIVAGGQLAGTGKASYTSGSGAGPGSGQPVNHRTSFDS